MSEGREYTFKINAYTPETIPMSRLAEYMSDLALLLGESASVHFVRLDVGSVRLVHKVEEAAIPKVETRVKQARSGEGPDEVVRAFRNINRRLREDNGDASLSEDVTGAEIIEFPGRRAAEEKVYGSVTQKGSVDGEVVRVGGTQEIVYVHLQAAGHLYKCTSNRTIAKTIAQYLYTGEVRAFGEGKWIRGQDGLWQLDIFKIQNFEVLNDETLSDVVYQLRHLQGNEWPSLSDPWAELDQIRNGNSKVH